MTTDEYLSLITSAHSDSPRFEATVAVGVSPFARIQEVLNSLIVEFDIDTATGVQLDVVGEWVGFSRIVQIQLSGVYFSWDDSQSDGWESGVWKGKYDPETGPMKLNDDEYRTLVKAKISVNNWNGSISEAYDIWTDTFKDGSFILIQDNNDMSMTIAIAGKELSIVEKRLIVNGGLLMKPEGVRLYDVVFTRSNAPLFCFDAQSEKLDGWEVGNWSESYFQFEV